MNMIEKVKNMNDTELRDHCAGLKEKRDRLDREFPWEQQREFEATIQELFIADNELKNRNK